MLIVFTVETQRRSVSWPSGQVDLDHWDSICIGIRLLRAVQSPLQIKCWVMSFPKVSLMASGRVQLSGCLIFRVQGLSTTSALRLHGCNLRMTLLDTPCSGHGHWLSRAVLCAKYARRDLICFLMWTGFSSLFSLWVCFLECSFWLYFHSNYWYSQLPERL